MTRLLSLCYRRRMLPGQRSTSTRLVSALLLALWILPCAAALGVGLHLAVEHHGEHHQAAHHQAEHHHQPAHHEEHALDISDLVEATAPGNHSGEASAEHDHGARIAELAPASRTLVSAAVSPLPTRAALFSPSLAPRRHDAPRRGPSVPLLPSHCVLLL